MDNMKCCICGNPILDKFGNNPYPVKAEGRCCDECNWEYVIPARIINLRRKEMRTHEEDR